MRRALIAGLAGTLVALALLAVPGMRADPGGVAVTAPGGQTAATGPGTTAPLVSLAGPSPPLLPLLGLELRLVAAGLREPLAVSAPPGDDRLFVAEKGGPIRVIEDGRLRERPFLDLSARVDADGVELGLLGLAFHPDYATNGRFFVYYSNHRRDTVLAEYRVSPFDPGTAYPGSGRELLTVDQPQVFHQGGMLAFGPDGYLYLGSGDGGGIGDQYGNAQDPGTLLGAILRLDVDHGDPYAVPPDNPFVAGGGAGEVWAYGLRNPWRFGFDPLAGLIYIGDVGQYSWEEVSVLPIASAGANLGWPIMEAATCYELDYPDDDCDRSGLVAPVISYRHDTGCAVIGGTVYRGQDIPEIAGHYFYGDWCGGWIRSFRFDGSAAVEQRDWTAELGTPGQVMSLGTDSRGELYVATQGGDGGALWKVVPVRDRAGDPPQSG